MSKSYLKTGRTNQKLETRKEILETAKYFLNNGLDFNLEDIAKKAGISRATVYRYFSNIDILASEAGLDISTKSPDEIIENLNGDDLENNVLEIQDYYNHLALDHEKLFRKYLSIVLDSNNSTPKRGARRKHTLQLVLKDTNFTDEEKEKLSNLLTIFMGIEPLIVTKDVCGLNNKESIELMEWGMKLLFKGLIHDKNK
ncbi:TetR/AcrR family transcriptional regulator [Algoriphagus machipongonensis]|uniref:TetR family transcriptional regulator n=1 Tax=Algoriphagus machipongonensis TaxID=388413 RepID=A3HYY7_9BACT|nr:TetR/AcrR family transcriptional regulator [Algoriphagus machipongonensis]EAZ80473.1 TetR family transcriptional regulator [Algoriphagus machipongonensis]